MNLGGKRCVQDGVHCDIWGPLKPGQASLASDWGQFDVFSIWMQNGVERMDMTWPSTLLWKEYKEDFRIVYKVSSQQLPAYPVKLAYKTDIIITILHIRKLRHKLNSSDYPMVTYLQLGEAKTTPAELYYHVFSFLMLRVAP